MISKRVNRRRGHRINGVPADELFDVQHIAVLGVLCARARPQQTLRSGSLCCHCSPAIGVDELSVPLVRNLRVCDGDRAQKALRRRLFVSARHFLQPARDQCVHRGVDAAHEEARHARDAADVGTAGNPGLQTCEIRLGDGLVCRYREQQRHVDVDAVFGELANRRDALGRARHLDHHVRAADG